MLAAIRHHLTRTALVMTPFLLSACGDDGKSTGGTKFELLLLPATLYVISVIHDWSKARVANRAAAAVA